MEPFKCYLAYDIQDDISILKDVFSENNIEFADIFNSFQTDNQIILDIRDKIEKCDFCIGILKNEYQSNVLFEVGVSIGLKKPTYMILSGNQVELPFSVKNILYNRSPLDNKKLLQLAITNFLEKFRGKKKKKMAFKNKKIFNKEFIDNQLIELSNIRKNGDEKKLADLLTNLFNGLKIQYSSTEKIGNTIADFIIWQDDPSGNVSKIIPVEIKYGNLDLPQIKNAENQLSDLMRQENSEFGLLLYLDKSRREYNQNYSRFPLIIRMDVEDFANSLTKDDLFSLLLKMRNRIVHQR